MLKGDSLGSKLSIKYYVHFKITVETVRIVTHNGGGGDTGCVLPFHIDNGSYIMPIPHPRNYMSCLKNSYFQN
jgi:hypothetical protein